MSGTVDAPIGRHPKLDYKWAVTADGKDSITHYDTIEAYPATPRCWTSSWRPAA